MTSAVPKNNMYNIFITTKMYSQPTGFKGFYICLRPSLMNLGHFQSEEYN